MLARRNRMATMIALWVSLCGLVMAVGALNGVVVIVFAHEESPVRLDCGDVTTTQIQSQT